MADFWILIVDDEDGVLSVLKNSLRKLGEEFHVSTAASGEAALDLLIQRKFDLVVTDYKMTGMNGLELLESIHTTRADTRVILMTAYGSAAVENEASRLQAYRYLSKPLEIEAFRQIVREAAGSPAAHSGILVLSEKDYREVNRILCMLQADVAARCILLTDRDGRHIARTGNLDNMDLAQIASLLSGSITTLEEAGRSIDREEEGVSLVYRESKTECLYAVSVAHYLVVLIIDRGPYSAKLGAVWHSAQKAAIELREKFRVAEYRKPDNTVGQDLEQALYGELQKILVEEESTGSLLRSANPSGNSESQPSTSYTALLTYEEAVEHGILPRT